MNVERDFSATESRHGIVSAIARNDVILWLDAVYGATSGNIM